MNEKKQKIKQNNTKAEENILNQAFEKVGQILKATADHISTDREIKNNLYVKIAKFIKSKSDFNLHDCLYATYKICKEDDKNLLMQCKCSENINDIINEIENNILTIKIHYEKINNRTYKYCLEIYFIENNEPALTRIQEEINYDYLPSEIREYFLQNDDKKIVIKLFSNGD